MQEGQVGKLAGILYSLLRLRFPEHQWKSLISTLQAFDLRYRKQLITLCRSLSIPPTDTSLYLRCSDVLSYVLENTNNLREIFLECITDPLLAGLIISLCISLPLSADAIRSTKSSLLMKEILVMESSPLPTAINYNVFFGAYSESIHPSVPPNPRMAFTVHKLIDNWIESLTSKEYHLPHMTSKLCSKSTQELVRTKYPDYDTFEEEGATQPDLEVIYMRFGDQLCDSPCEIKQRWYTSGLTPRTYYAAGSEAYHRSKYVRNALNSLCDFLPPTERYSRVNPHRIVLSKPSSHALIYDLSSFTSNMHEQRHFLSRLGLYCHGHTIRILDSCNGLVDVDLGDLLLEYNRMNIEPSYASDYHLGEDVQLVHHVAGFLGVFGNLASCTFLHGAVVSQLVSTFSQVGVAGDDGLVDSEDDFTTFFVIRLLGLMEETKGYNTQEPGKQVYLKRPIFQIGCRLYAESFALYSMIEHMFRDDDPRFFPTQRSNNDRKSSLASAIVVYLRSLCRIILSDEEKEQVLEFLTQVYHHAGFPLCGSVPQIHPDLPSNTYQLPSGLLPTIDLNMFGEDPIEYTINTLYDGIAVIKEQSIEKIEIDFSVMYAGSVFRCTQSAILSYYRKMGFVEMSQDEVYISGEDGLKSLLRYYSPTRSYAVYTVSLLEDVPIHLLP